MTFVEAKFIMGLYTYVFSRNKKVCKCSSEHILIKVRMSQLRQAAGALFCLFSLYFDLFWGVQLLSY